MNFIDEQGYILFRKRPHSNHVSRLSHRRGLFFMDAVHIPCPTVNSSCSVVGDVKSFDNLAACPWDRGQAKAKNRLDLFHRRLHSIRVSQILRRLFRHSLFKVPASSRLLAFLLRYCRCRRRHHDTIVAIVFDADCSTASATLAASFIPSLLVALDCLNVSTRDRRRRHSLAFV